MGLFQKLPEDPVEWAGLPSEPLPDLPAAERLPDAAPVDLGLGTVAEFGSISISVPVDEAVDGADAD